MNFLHISDLHYLKEYPGQMEGYLSIFKNITSPKVWLKKGMDRFHHEQLSFILISGDLTENGSEEDYRALKDFLDDLFKGIPYVVTLGNHDNRQAFYQVWADTAGALTDGHYGSVNVFGSVLVVALDNSSDRHPDGLITKKHCLWLEEKLRQGEAERQTTILMMHHPLVFDPEVAIPVALYPDEFIGLLRRYRPAAILCGHTHHPISGLFEQVFYATAGSMSFRGFADEAGMVSFREYASANLVRLEEHFLAVETISIQENGSLLGRIKM